MNELRILSKSISQETVERVNASAYRSCNTIKGAFTMFFTAVLVLGDESEKVTARRALDILGL